tara:strand:+ start:617 stop:748 length:132 start_codon:yes stop_codon:yes gene_type:complete
MELNKDIKDLLIEYAEMYKTDTNFEKDLRANYYAFRIQNLLKN